MNSPNSSTPRLKNAMYVQQMNLLPLPPDKLQEALEQKVCPKRYAYIVHDKDKDDKGNLKAPHLHLMMSFENARSLNSVAKLLCDKPQQVEAWRGNANNGYAYLIHATKEAQNEYQYSPDEVTANFDYAEALASIQTEIRQAKNVHSRPAEIKELLDLLLVGVKGKEEVLSMLSGSEYAANHKKVDDVYNRRLQNQAAEWRKEMIASNKEIQVIWIYGEAGTGKTRFAKKKARDMERPFFLSGSSRDAFQNYAGEHTVILDELRPNMMAYHDLLRILDPFGAQEKGLMAPSRYYDKALAADLILITTPYNPRAFYLGMFANGLSSSVDIDNFEQLLRRISVTIEMDDQQIKAMEYDKKATTFVEIPGTAKPNPYSAANSAPQAAADPVALFDSLFA